MHYRTTGRIGRSIMKKSSKNKIGVGLVTYNRPDYFKLSSQAIIERLEGIVDEIVIYNDGSDEQFLKDYEKQYRKLLKHKVTIIAGVKNQGVGKAKNILFRDLLARGCNYIFISEDDVVVQSPKAITGYIELSKKTGIEHFNFAHHGLMNPKADSIEGDVAYFPNCVGAWSLYTRNCLESVGLLDEHFHNAWEHVEHTARLARSGLTSPFWKFADHKDSQEWIKEIGGSLDHSSIRVNPQWYEQMKEGMIYWKAKDGIGIPQH